MLVLYYKQSIQKVIVQNLKNLTINSLVFADQELPDQQVCEYCFEDTGCWHYTAATAFCAVLQIYLAGSFYQFSFKCHTFLNARPNEVCVFYYD